MTLSFLGYLWILGGLYFTLVGRGMLPLPRNIRAWFDAAGRERYRVAPQTVGPVLVITGVARLFRLI